MILGASAGIYTRREALTRGVTKWRPKKASFLRRAEISSDRRQESEVFQERPSGKFNSATVNISLRFALESSVPHYQFESRLYAREKLTLRAKIGARARKVMERAGRDGGVSNAR